MGILRRLIKKKQKNIASVTYENELDWVHTTFFKFSCMSEYVSLCISKNNRDIQLWVITETYCIFIVYRSNNLLKFYQFDFNSNNFRLKNCLWSIFFNISIFDDRNWNKLSLEEVTTIIEIIQNAFNTVSCFDSNFSSLS